MLLEWLHQQKPVCFDTETTGLDQLTAELVGIAFSWKKGTGYYLPFPEDRTACETKLAYFAPFFQSSEIEKVGHNLKYDIKVLQQYGMSVQAPLFDTMIAHYLINPDPPRARALAAYCCCRAASSTLNLTRCAAPPSATEVNDVRERRACGL